MTSQSNKSTPRKELRNSEADWRGTSQQSHAAPSAPRKSFTVKTFLKIALVILVLSALYSTQHPDCKSWRSSTFKHCVD